MSDTGGPTPRSLSESEEKANESYRRFFELPLDRYNLFDSINLRRSRIVLASDLNPVIDFFNSSDVGIGGRDARQAAAELNLNTTDQKRLSALLRLRSYDVYTLRAALGDHLTPERFDELALPDSEKRMLEEYTRDYTRALFTLIFEDSGIEAPNRQAMRDLLEGDTKDIVQRNVLGLADKFAIRPTELVNYIAALGEMLLAIAFYRRAFEVNRSALHRFLKEIKILHDHQSIGVQNTDVQQNARKILAIGARTAKQFDAYFASFNDIGKIWEHITPERFRMIREEIEAQYPMIGSSLCIWQVKLDAWDHRFHRPGRKAADNSPVQFGVFFEERIFPNFDRVEYYLDRIRPFDSTMNAPRGRRLPPKPAAPPPAAK